MSPVMEELKRRTNDLYSLLADPEPGLMSWNEAVYYSWDKIIALRSEEPKTKKVKP